MRRDALLQHIQNGSYDVILNQDQLRRSTRIDPSFRLRDFVEGDIAFAPTYKYDKNSERYDTSEKQRAPAWCDRILLHSRMRANESSNLTYQRHEVLTSDHRPVSALWRVHVKKIDPEKRRAVLDNVSSKLE